jgi:hypothetical protein
MGQETEESGFLWSAALYRRFVFHARVEKKRDQSGGKAPHSTKKGGIT